MIRLPYDWRTPLGCTMAFIHQFISFSYLLHCCTIVVTFLIGSCAILQTFTADMKSHLKALNHKRTTKGQLEIISEFVEFHATVKQLSVHLNIISNEQKIKSFHFSGLFMILSIILQSLSRPTICGVS